MLLLPWPASAWVLGVLIMLAAPGDRDPLHAGDGDAERRRRGVRRSPRASRSRSTNLAWGIGQAVGDAGSGRLADATGDRVPYLILAGGGAVTLAVLVRQLARRAPARPLASRA